VYVTGAGVASGLGFAWRGLAAAAGTAAPAPRVPPTPPGHEPCERRQLRMMSRAAYLGAVAVKACLDDAGWTDGRQGVGLFMGVGASGGEIGELEALLAASVADGAFDLGRFGGAGLAAANPLFAFQLMNNFSLCHGAILAGLRGPNGALFSRGAGTVTALREAAFALATGDAARALAGGADSALYPVTLSELGREGRLAAGMVPAEGAALLALESEAPPARRLARLARAEVHADVGNAMAAPISPGGLLVLCPWGEPARAALAPAAAGFAGTVVDLSSLVGDALAATPALGWALALSWLQGRDHGEALVLSAGLDGEIGAVALAREAA
jgi:3-oxoacyl-(acyl-carrier-protein) synthase